MSNLPSLKDLNIFCIVVRNLSFNATAIELGACHAFVSKRIAVLEDHFNVRLLHRSTRKVSLTNDGEVVYRWALRLLEDAEQMNEEVSSAKSAPQGTLRVSSTVGFGRKHIAPILSEMALKYPKLKIELEMFYRPVDIIREGYDLDINFGLIPDSNLMVRHIATNYRILCAAPSYLKQHGVPNTVEDLTKHYCLPIRERDEPFGLWRLKNIKHKKGKNSVVNIKVSGPLSCSNGEIAHQWAIDGHGIILRSMWDINSSLADGRLVRILPDYIQQADISAVYPIRLTDSAKVRVFIQLLEERLKDLTMLN
jgi:LysR family transcriptional activator of dmlA